MLIVLDSVGFLIKDSFRQNVSKVMSMVCTVCLFIYLSPVFLENVWPRAPTMLSVCSIQQQRTKVIITVSTSTPYLLSSMTAVVQ